MNEPRATRYQRLRRRADAMAMASGVAALAVVALTPASRALASLAEAYGRGLSPAPQAGLAVLILAAALVACWQIAAAPAALYRARQVDRRYGASVAPAVDGVLAAQAQTALLAFPPAALAGLIVQGSAWLAGPAWWALAGALLAAALVAALHGAPRSLAHLAAARPLVRPELVRRLEALARRAGVPIAAIHVVSSGAAAPAALVAGVGRSRRVFLSADVESDWSDDEIAVVVAHELAHHAHHDLPRTLALDALVLAAGLWTAHVLLGAFGRGLGVGGADDLAALPFIALAAGGVWLAATPLRHAYSRHQERQADGFALRATGGAAAFAAALRRLSARHLAEERPSTITRWLYHRHPPVGERLAYAERVRQDL